MSQLGLACHNNFYQGSCPLELAQGLSRVALAWHNAGGSTPFGVTEADVRHSGRIRASQASFVFLLLVLVLPLHIPFKSVSAPFADPLADPLVDLLADPLPARMFRSPACQNELRAFRLSWRDTEPGCTVVAPCRAQGAPLHP